MIEVDVLTIGAGGGAYPGAFRLARAGFNVLMVDKKGVMSGNCLAEGCVPSKAIREQIHTYLRFKVFNNVDVEMDYKRILSKKDEVQNIRYKLHEEELKAFKNLKLIKGVARFKDEHTVVVESDKGEEVVKAKYIIIASGADVFVPPIKGKEYAITSTDIYKLNPNLTYVPKEFAIVGGGYIGLETAFYFANLGSNVYIFEKLDRVLAGIDRYATQTLLKYLPKNIKIFTSVEVQEIALKDKKKVLYYKQDDAVKSVEVDEVLMAVGRRPVIPEGADKFLHINKAIEINNACQTNIPHIYASGDVNGKIPLFHTAIRQSLVCAHNIMANNTPVDYADFENVPFTVFTIPAMAFVGITKEKAENLNMDIVETSFDLKEDSRAEMYAEEGELRLFFDAKSLKLVGAYIVGTDAEQLVSHLGLAIKLGATARDLAEYQDQHPMTQECISKAARKLF
ncbi:MAG: dihydrolipoyl dehydrogenase [Hydrogenobaculum sp.]|nr:MAG: dihydrolipoyl dehydrogenase [Hydrogenobaculum sp.]